VYSDLSRGRDRNCISVVNGVDDEGCPGGFLYVSEYVETMQMNVNRSIASLKVCSLSSPPVLHTV